MKWKLTGKRKYSIFEEDNYTKTNIICEGIEFIVTIQSCDSYHNLYLTSSGYITPELSTRQDIQYKRYGLPTFKDALKEISRGLECLMYGIKAQARTAVFKG